MCLSSNEPNYLRLSTAAKRLPGRPSPKTLWRWCRGGCRVGKRRVHLKFVQVGRGILTTAEWCDAFVNEVAELSAAAVTSLARAEAKRQKNKNPNVRPTIRSRRRQYDDADAALRAAGM